ncbi:uncharacterized protein EDB93DRAFT_1109178 [Suillus bovinus]|uniref:uncharacterized protein n=1 Tax=Suillus bovinus TaxID=48563 RepID=UPI001B86CF55|nr:uncharacterized protein EDB93DRAFT_1109178 [Suillus bovinus]KAG2127652.1 hypothetical protein EDB93DRAFT_1109178 [Suillus bovinus]
MVVQAVQLCVYPQFIGVRICLGISEAELFPVSALVDMMVVDKLGGRKIAIMNMALYLTNTFNSLINPMALNTIGWKYYLFYCGRLILELLFMMVYIIEMRVHTLEETTALFDRLKVHWGILEWTSEVAMNLATYPRPEDSAGTVQSCSSASPSHFGSPSDESAVAFAR